MAKINYNQLLINLEKPLERAFRQKAIEVAERKFENTKEKFLNAFMEDPVTEEIRAGNSVDSSAILGESGNLYSFIGFEENPIDALYDWLDTHIKFNKNPRYRNGIYSFSVSIPTKESIAGVTPMPWGTAASWVFAIESGISGLNRYLSTQRYIETFGKEPNPPLGRSEGGIQIKVATTSGGYTPRNYMTKYLKMLEEEMEG